MKTYSNYGLKSTKKTFLIYLSALIFAALGCRKFVELDPPIQSIVNKEIFNSNATATSVLAGIYTDMSSFGIFAGRASININMGLSADELSTVALPSDILTNFYTNSLNREDAAIWYNLYSYVYRINGAIEGISVSTGITDPVKKQLLGECKFLRAFMYFYLVNLYGDVPLVLTTDIKENSTIPRTEKDKVYEQMVNDLNDAEEGLSMDYLSGDAQTKTTARVRPNKFVASALLSRIHLYMKSWTLAESEATKLINNVNYDIVSLDECFKQTSKEAIWQLQSVIFGMNTPDAYTFVLDEGNGVPQGPNSDGRPVFLSENFYSSFEINDERKTRWIGVANVGNKEYPYSYKYKSWLLGEPSTEYLVVFRLAEQYLIRAEARANLGKIIGDGSAAQDLNIIRNRAGLEPTTASSLPSIKEAILKERRSEIFTEFGHRWLDLKRSGTIDQVMSAIGPSKGASWNTSKALYPIPVSEISKNPSLRGHQNPGYPEQ